MTDSDHRPPTDSRRPPTRSYHPPSSDGRRATQTSEGTARVALAPDLRSMPDRAARAWAERMAVRPVGEGEYAVESQSGATYVVDPLAGTCTCPDATIRGETCKHLRRVAIEITTRRVPPPGKRRAECGACGRDAFVSEDSDPAALCGTCHLDPGDVALDRETGDRLVVAMVTDRRAEDVIVPEADVTVAEYPTNDGYPDDDIVFEATYLTEAVASDEPRRYSFPRSRLRRTDEAALVE